MTQYTTVKGNKVPLTPDLFRGIRRVAAKRFDGSKALFNACWLQYLDYVDGGTDNPQSIDDVMQWLETIASEKVNDSASEFYIYG